MVLETERMVLHEFRVDDAPFLLRLVNDPSWLQYIGDRHVYSIGDAERYLLEGSIKSYADHGFGFYKVELKSTGEAMGSAGLAKRDYLEEVDLGFAFLPEFTGKGYAFEIAGAILEHAKNFLQLNSLVAFTTQDNVSSIKLLLKLGFHFESPMMLEEEQLNLYRIQLV